MSLITNCPVCETQFEVTDEQLNQYNGKVRCGNCLNVFNATKQLIEFETPSEAVHSTETDSFTVNKNTTDGAGTLGSTQEYAQLYATDYPVIDSEFIDDEVSLLQSASDETNIDTDYYEVVNYENIEMEAIDADLATPLSAPNLDTTNVNTTVVNESQSAIFNKQVKKATRNPRKSTKKTRIWLVLLLAFVLLLIAFAQSIYFLRSEIAIYYPNTKPYLVQACKQLGCNIDLPKKIELIVIDDSDIQEDADYTGLIHLSSTLINRAGFSQTYPNLELTLTDTEDKPKLRRIFKPNEYLPANVNIANGIAAGEEIKVKLAITTQGEKVAGYRVLVTY